MHCKESESELVRPRPSSSNFHNQCESPSRINALTGLIVIQTFSTIAWAADQESRSCADVKGTELAKRIICVGEVISARYQVAIQLQMIPRQRVATRPLTSALKMALSLRIITKKNCPLSQIYLKYKINSIFSIDVGQFDTILGVEANDSKVRLFNKTGTTYDLALPVTHTGTMLTFEKGHFEVKGFAANPNNKGSNGTSRTGDDSTEYGLAIGYSNNLLHGKVG